MEAKGIINGKIVEIKGNEAGTHYYVDGSRISRNTALEAIKLFDNRKTITASVKNNDFNRFNRVAGIFYLIANIKSVKEKQEIIKKHTKDKIMTTLIKLNRKSEPARGFSGKRLSKIYDVYNTEKDGPLPKVTDLDAVEKILAELGKSPVFELTLEVRRRLAKIIAKNDAEQLGDIVSRKVKTGLSDKQINELLEIN